MIATHQNRVYSPRTRTADGRHVIQAVLRCWLCRREETLNIRPDLPPDQVLKKFRQKGWETNDREARRIICPHCIAERDGKRVRKPKGDTMNAPAKHQPAPIVQLPPPPVIRRVLSAIEDHFDEDKGCYCAGWDDKKIGEEMQIGWAIVAKIREDYGLKIKGDPEVMALRSEVETWVKMGADILARLDSLQLARAR